MLAYLVLCPIAYSINGQPMRQFQELFFQFIGMMLVVSCSKNLWITLFFALNGILYILNGYGDIGAVQTMNIFIGICIFITARSFFKKFDFIKEIKILYWVLGITLLWTTLQLFGIDPLFSIADNHGNASPGESLMDPLGIFGIKAAHGVFLALMIPIVACKNVWLALLLFIPIAVCRSTGALGAGILGYLFYLYQLKIRQAINIPEFRVKLHKFNKVVSINLKPKLFFIFLVPLIVAGSLFVFTNDYKWDKAMFSTRFGVWHAGVHYSLKKPWGYGPDSWRDFTKHKNFIFTGDDDSRNWIASKSGDAYKYVYYHPNKTKMMLGPEFMRENATYARWDNPHNLYLTILFEYGIFGLFLLAGLIREMRRRYLGNLKTKELVLITTCLVIFMLASVTQFPIHLARLGYLFPVLLGAFYGVTDRRDE